MSHKTPPFLDHFSKDTIFLPLMQAARRVVAPYRCKIDLPVVDKIRNYKKFEIEQKQG